MSTWTQTFTGRRFELLDPTPEMVHADDIIVSLSRLVRYNGHTTQSYRVAQHVVLCAAMVHEAGGSEQEMLAALLHDGHEAYLSDVPSPLKWAIGDSWEAFEKIEAGVDAAIAEKFGLDPTAFKSDIVKLADISALWHEYHALFTSHEHEWSWEMMFAGREPFPLPVAWEGNFHAWSEDSCERALRDSLSAFVSLAAA